MIGLFLLEILKSQHLQNFPSDFNILRDQTFNFFFSLQKKQSLKYVELGGDLGKNSPSSFYIQRFMFQCLSTSKVLIHTFTFPWVAFMPPHQFLPQAPAFPCFLNCMISNFKNVVVATFFPCSLFFVGLHLIQPFFIAIPSEEKAEVNH